MKLDWFEQVACKGSTAFTPDRKPTDTEMVNLWAVCASCPVRRECAEHSLIHATSGFYAGVWLPPERGEPRQSARNVLRKKAGAA